MAPFLVAEVKFENPEWVTQGTQRPNFTKEGVTFLENVLKKVITGDSVLAEWDAHQRVGFRTIEYTGQLGRAANGEFTMIEPRLLLVLVKDTDGIYLHVYVIPLPQDPPLGMTPQQQAFVMSFTKALAKALPVKDGKMDILTQPDVPLRGTRFDRLPDDVLKHIIRPMAAEVKQKDNPLMKLAKGGKKTRKVKRKAKKTRRGR